MDKLETALLATLMLNDFIEKGEQSIIEKIGNEKIMKVVNHIAEYDFTSLSIEEQEDIAVDIFNKLLDKLN